MKHICLLALAISSIITSCYDDSDDCICTMEFRIITVVVVDQFNNPVKELLTIIRDDKNKIYNVQMETLFDGHYPVMSDKYTNEFTPVPRRILFYGQSDSLEVNGEYMINADNCKCHINKVSGPDTLVLR